MEALHKTAADHWSRVAYPGKVRWHQSPTILRHLNRLLCGEAIHGPWAGFNRKLSTLEGAPFERAVSVGCGGARKEIEVLRLGIVKHFDLFEISETRLNHAKTFAEQLGLADRVTCYLADAFAKDLGQYDLVYWNNALHHMLDTRHAVRWSHERLKPGGVLVMDDYVGPNRFQWSDEAMRITRRVRECLPEDYLRHPRDRSVVCPLVVARPNVDQLIATDPTEAADCEAILPALRDTFGTVEVQATGGVVYMLALVDIIGNFNEVGDLPLLQSFLLLDEELAQSGLTHYAVAIARK